MNKFIYLVILLFFLNSFTYREPKYCKMLDSITSNYVKEFAAPRCLKFSGYGGAMMDDIQSITLRFISSSSLNVEEARALYIEMMEEFLRRINHHEKIRPHLYNFPFQEKNIKLTICFEDSKGNNRSDGHVAMIFLNCKGTLYYDAYDSQQSAFYTLNKESYDEALKKYYGI